VFPGSAVHAALRTFPAGHFLVAIIGGFYSDLAATIGLVANDYQSAVALLHHQPDRLYDARV